MNTKSRLKKKLMKMNLTTISSILILFFIITIWALLNQINHTVVDTLLNKSYDSQIFVMKNLKSTGDNDKLGYLKRIGPYLAKYISEPGEIRVQIISKDMELSGDSISGEELIISKDIKVSLENTKAYSFFLNKKEPYLSFSSPIYLENGTIIGSIRYLYPMNKEYRKVYYIAVILLGVIILGLLLSYITTHIISTKIVSPVNELKAAINNIQSGFIEQKIDIKSGDEIEELGIAFNLMSKNLNNYISKLSDERDRQRIFFSNITHKLKTPLTSIIGYSELIQRLSENDDVCESAFIIEEAGENLLFSIENLLRSAKFSIDSYEPIYNKFKISDVIEESLIILSPRIDKWNIGIIKEVDDIEIISDRDLIKEVILTLLDNCLLHSRCENIEISSHMNMESGQVQISIHDDGIGIKEGDIKHIFDPFYRPIQNTTKGSGLGLYTSKSIINMLAGEIFINEDNDIGTEIIIYIPNYYISETIG
ncbi:ATP-binding protein [Tissierellaceae bacterium HCP3S3_D8]